MDPDQLRASDAPGTPVREQPEGPGRTIPTSPAPEATTGAPMEEEDTRWWFLGIAGVGVLVLLIALGIVFL